MPRKKTDIKDHYTFMASWHAAMKELITADNYNEYGKMMFAINEYILSDIEPVFNDPSSRAIWALVEPIAKRGKALAAAAKKGGAPQGNNNGKRTAAVPGKPQSSGMMQQQPAAHLPGAGVAKSKNQQPAAEPGAHLQPGSTPPHVPGAGDISTQQPATQDPGELKPIAARKERFTKSVQQARLRMPKEWAEIPAFRNAVDAFRLHWNTEDIKHPGLLCWETFEGRFSPTEQLKKWLDKNTEWQTALAHLNTPQP